MKILFDTNIFIHREDDDVVPPDLRKLERYLKEQDHDILIHPQSEHEIRNDQDVDRRQRNASRIETYPTLGFPSYPTDNDREFRKHVKEASDFNESVDNVLLYAVYDNVVDFLITEDQGIHKKAINLGLEDRVFTIADGKDYFSPEEGTVLGPHAIERTTLGELDFSDPIFDSLKSSYDFVKWAESKSDRTAWVNYSTDGSIGAILVLKHEEVEPIGESPSLGEKRRMKISTLKVAEDRWGSKIGELLISLAIREAINNEHEEVYLTYFVDGASEDYFVELINSYGFEHVSETHTGEAIFLKRLTPGPGDSPGAIETTKKFYPSFHDGDLVNKFLVPIRPEWHNRLFTAYSERQPGLLEFDGKFTPEGNAIKKAYLFNAKNKQIDPGDILLFYRSTDHKQITSVGVCESVHYDLRDGDEIRKIVGKRAVFSESDINEMAKAGTHVLLFRWHFDLNNFISYKKLLDSGVLSGPLQRITMISEQAYDYIKMEGKIDERFTIN